MSYSTIHNYRLSNNLTNKLGKLKEAKKVGRRQYMQRYFHVQQNPTSSHLEKNLWCGKYE